MGGLAAAPPTLEIEVRGALDVDLSRRHATGRDAWVRAGPVRACCGQLELRYGADGLNAATCSEDVVVVIEPPPGENATSVRGTADRLRYVAGQFELEGAVRLWALGGELRGDRLTYRLEGRRARLVGAPSRWTPAQGPPELPRPCPAAP